MAPVLSRFPTRPPELVAKSFRSRNLAFVRHAGTPAEKRAPENPGKPYNIDVFVAEVHECRPFFNRFNDGHDDSQTDDVHDFVLYMMSKNYWQRFDWKMGSLRTFVIHYARWFMCAQVAKRKVVIRRNAQPLEAAYATASPSPHPEAHAGITTVMGFRDAVRPKLTGDEAETLDALIWARGDRSKAAVFLATTPDDAAERARCLKRTLAQYGLNRVDLAMAPAEIYA